MAAIFQSLLFEAAGRTINPVNGAVGLLWTGNWHECQAAVETVLCSGTLRPASEFHSTSPGFKGVSDSNNTFKHGNQGSTSRSKRRRLHESSKLLQVVDLDLSLMQGYEVSEKRQLDTVSRNSEESVTTTWSRAGEPKLLNLF